MTGAIYQIMHVASGRLYVGQCASIKRRWAGHKRHLNAGTHHAPHLQAAWKAYGPEAFVFQVIEFCAKGALDAREQFYLDMLQPAFNTAKFAQTRRGVPHTEESKAKIGAAHRGLKRSPEACANIAAGHRGKKHTEESKAKMRAAKIGKKLSPERVAAMTEMQRTRERPPEEYASRRGRVCPEEIRAKMSAAKRAGYALRRKAGMSGRGIG